MQDKYSIGVEYYRENKGILTFVNGDYVNLWRIFHLGCEVVYLDDECPTNKIILRDKVIDCICLLKSMSADEIKRQSEKLYVALLSKQIWIHVCLESKILNNLHEHIGYINFNENVYNSSDRDSIEMYFDLNCNELNDEPDAIDIIDTI